MNAYKEALRKPYRTYVEPEKVAGDIRKELAELVINKLDGVKKPKLLRLISPDQSQRFIKKIFHKKSMNYIRFVRKIDATPNWRYALYEILKTYSRNSVNYYTKEGLELSNYIYLKYFPKDSYHRFITKKK